MDSKCSRERSREEEKNKLDLSQDSREEEERSTERFNVFDDEINYLSHPSTESDQIRYDNFALRNFYNEFKVEKKTNDQEDQEEEDDTKRIPSCLMNFENQDSSSVKPSSIEELDREYNRLLNFTEGENVENGFFLDFDGGNRTGGNCWLFEAEDRPMTWSDLDE